ncbi:tetratricopeptide repeat protein [Shewanella sp. ULN5]|uniref:tetratricopeptide repeat protein n=1 Tax=Shewanella sp. ULN5 TaxID=2994678 RepID=UPI00273F98C4|nr:tetratricopeptide repeat protein [Shewanella sp. ULN5]MDP5147044.1 tetratricopeptide repeat protein [Shewanella sp. ULN5]
MGIEALESKDYQTATVFMSKFLREAPYFHLGYLALARAQLGMGNKEQAEEALNKAVILTNLPEHKKVYLAKLDWLNKPSH